jgi:hypothetical protein
MKFNYQQNKNITRNRVKFDDPIKKYVMAQEQYEVKKNTCHDCGCQLEEQESYLIRNEVYCGTCFIFRESY